MADLVCGRRQAVPSVHAHAGTLQRAVRRPGLWRVSKRLHGTRRLSLHRGVHIRMVWERVRPARGAVPVRIGVRLNHAHTPSRCEAVVVVAHWLVRVVVLHVAHCHRLGGGLAFALALRFLCLLLLLAPLLPELLELCIRGYWVTDGGTKFGDQVSMSTTLHSLRGRYVPLGLRFGPCRCIVTCAFKWFRVPYAFVQLGQLSEGNARGSVNHLPIADSRSGRARKQTETRGRHRLRKSE